MDYRAMGKEPTHSKHENLMMKPVSMQNGYVLIIFLICKEKQKSRGRVKDGVGLVSGNGGKGQIELRPNVCPRHSPAGF